MIARVFDIKETEGELAGCYKMCGIPTRELAEKLLDGFPPSCVIEERELEEGIPETVEEVLADLYALADEWDAEDDR